MPDILSFLYHKPTFADHYCSNIELSCFESVTLQIVSFIFEVKVIVHSISESNSFLFATIFNNRYTKKSQFVAYEIHGIPTFRPVFEISGPPHFNSLIEKEKKMLEAPLISKELSKEEESPSEMAIYNENMASIKSKEMGEIEEERTEDNRKSQGTTDNTDINVHEYASFVQEYLATVSQVHNKLNKLKENEVRYLYR